MKRILMAMVVAGMLAVAIPFAPVQVQEAEAATHLNCTSLDVDHNRTVDITDQILGGAEWDAEDWELFNNGCYGDLRGNTTLKYN